MEHVIASLERGTIHVWRASLDQQPEVVSALDALLSDDERDRRDRFRFERDRTRSVVGRGLLRTMLGHYVALDPALLRFWYTRHRKPKLTSDGPHFNLAHSGSAALFAF